MLTKMPASPQVHRSKDTAPIFSPGIVTLNRNHSRIGPYDDWIPRRGRFVGQTCFIDQGVWGYLERTCGRADKSVKQTSQLEAQHHWVPSTDCARTHRSISCKGTGCPPRSQASTYRMPQSFVLACKHRRTRVPALQEVSLKDFSTLASTHIRWAGAVGQ